MQRHHYKMMSLVWRVLLFNFFSVENWISFTWETNYLKLNGGFLKYDSWKRWIFFKLQIYMELLALPLDEEHRVKREEGLQGVRNVLWAVGGGGAAAIAGGYTRQDFMNEAFMRMAAAEQVDLFATTPSNIPVESFEVYGVVPTLVAEAFVAKKAHLIRDIDNLFLQLQQMKVTLLGTISNQIIRADHEVDFALERGLCSLLVGELDDCRSWLGLDNDNSPYRDPSIVAFV